MIGRDHFRLRGEVALADASWLDRPPRHEPHHDQLMPSVDPDLLLSKFDWTQLDTCRVSE